MASEKKNKQKGVKKRYGRNKAKCERYRLLVGKPNGPGKPGNKSGRNKIAKKSEED
jgi:hypothetical protein